MSMHVRTTDSHFTICHTCLQKCTAFIALKINTQFSLVLQKWKQVILLVNLLQLSDHLHKFTENKSDRKTNVCLLCLILRRSAKLLFCRTMLPPLLSPLSVVFEQLTEKHLPELYQLLKHRLNILSMISLSWFLTLFFSVMDSSTAINILDCFFVDGAKVSGGRKRYKCTLTWYVIIIYEVYEARCVLINMVTLRISFDIKGVTLDNWWPKVMSARHQCSSF